MTHITQEQAVALLYSKTVLAAESGAAYAQAVCNTAIASDRAQCGEPVGITSEMPGSNGGFTMAVFGGTGVPVGANLYTAQPQPVNQQLVEALETSLSAMEMAVHFRETGQGRPPEQTCMDAIAISLAALAAAKEQAK